MLIERACPIILNYTKHYDDENEEGRTATAVAVSTFIFHLLIVCISSENCMRWVFFWIGSITTPQLGSASASNLVVLVRYFSILSQPALMSNALSTNHRGSMKSSEIHILLVKIYVAAIFQQSILSTELTIWLWCDQYETSISQPFWWA